MDREVSDNTGYGSGRFYTNPNHVGGTGAVRSGTPQQRGSSDQETLQLSMDANVLAVASGGGAGKSQQANRPPHGGGLTAGFGSDEIVIPQQTIQTVVKEQLTVKE